MRNAVLMLSSIAAVAAGGAPPEEAIRFDGKTAYRVPAAALDMSANAVSMAAWVKVRCADEPQVFVNRGRANTRFTFYLYKGMVRMLVGHGRDAYAYALAPPPEPMQWTHYAGTYDGRTVRVFRNGKLAAETAAAGDMGKAEEDLFVGALDVSERFVHGWLADVRLWRRVLSASEIEAVHGGGCGGPLDEGLVGRWQRVEGKQLPNAVAGGPAAEKASFHAARVLINGKADGFRGIWYYNQPSGDEYVYKYSGGLGTYCAKHIPLAWYCPEVRKTFFVFGGAPEDNSTLLHMVSFYDHRSGEVARPTVLLDKKTTDAHDNPVLNVDDRGYLWIFSSSHGKGRPSYISRSTKPYDINEFELVWVGNYSYPQPWYISGKGFLFMHTWYEGGRSIYQMTSPDGRDWSPRRLLARIDQGHYQVTRAFGGTVGSAFNMHPRGKGLNWRTNLYYMQTTDFGATWQTVDGRSLSLPLTEVANPALVVDYQAQGLNVYMKNLAFDSKGHPIILYITSKGYEAGPENMPRIWRTARWNGTSWEILGSIVSDSNYDMGPLYIETDTQWCVIGPTEVGPQPYNPGGEVAMWRTYDQGHTWKKIKQLTRNSPFNHTYVRRPVNAQPDFYGLWADGHGRQPSNSRLYFCTRDGDVFRLPEKMTAASAPPVPLTTP